MSVESIRSRLREIAEDIRRLVGEVEDLLRSAPKAEAVRPAVAEEASRPPPTPPSGYRLLREEEYRQLMDVISEARRWFERLKVLEEEVEALKSSLAAAGREPVEGLERAERLIMEEVDLLGEVGRERLVSRVSRYLDAPRSAIYKAIDSLASKGAIVEDRGRVKLARGVGRMDVKLEEYFTRRLREELGRVPMGRDLEELWIFVEGELRARLANLPREEALARAYEELDRLVRLIRVKVG